MAPDLAKPRFRLAQIAMMRGQYAAAADADSRGRNRAAGLDRQRPRYPGPLRRAGRFRQQRGAARDSSCRPIPTTAMRGSSWAAEWFLSGRTTKAADVFKRLNDPNRKPDVALAAFLDASNQAELQAG